MTCCKSGSIYLSTDGAILLSDIANLILTDTVAHVNYFMELFSVPKEKVVALPISSDEVTFPLIDERYEPSKDFTVFTYILTTLSGVLV